MIHSVCLDLKQIAKLGRDYLWPRPWQCARCGSSKVWGHGFVRVIFAGFARALQIRRYRCPVCGCIIRLRPRGYFERIQTDIATIRSRLIQRLNTGRWPRGPHHNRSRHWLCALKQNSLALLGMAWRYRPAEAFDQLIGMGRVPVRRSL
jgi:hypothetical protein